MASSQVEIASSSPFGCVLRDSNHGDGCKESNVKATHAALQRNIKNFVMDHLNTCMSMSSDSSKNQSENNVGSWVSNASNNINYDSNNNNKSRKNLRLARLKHANNKDESSLASLISPRHSRLLDQWAARQAQAMVSTLENEVELLSMHNNNNNSNILGRSCSSTSDETSSEISSLGASSLVQIWEKRLNKGNESKPNTPVSNGRTSPNSAAAAANNSDHALSSEAGESCYLPEEKELSSFADWESQSDQSSSPQGQWSSYEAADGDRVCVAEIIKKLTSPTPGQSPPPTLGDDNDLLMQLESDRHGELSNLTEQRAVSKFTQSGRIQSLLRLKLSQRDIPANEQAANDQCNQQSTLPRENKQPQESAIMQLRERFSTSVEHKTTVQTEVTCSKSSRIRIVSNTIPLDDSLAANEPNKDIHCKTVPADDGDRSRQDIEQAVETPALMRSENLQQKPNEIGYFFTMHTLSSVKFQLRSTQN